MSLFITFEGGEGSGKSVQARALYRRLVRLAVPALLTREPGGTGLGERLARDLKYARTLSISPLAELLMFNASRAQLVADVIKPALAGGKVVICDRFADSTIAYQSWGRGLDTKLVKTINDIATAGLTPSLTILLDVPVEEGLDRVKKRGAQKDRFEKEALAFHRRVRQGYLKMASEEPQRWLVIDSRQTKAVVAGIIWERVSRMLSRPVS